MKIVRVVLILILFQGFICSVSFAQKSKIHAGAVIGNPTGLTVKYWLTASNALEGTVALEKINRDYSFNLNVMYLIHTFNYLDIQDSPLALYYGVGGKVLTTLDVALGVRGVAGAAYFFSSLPIDLSLELSPIFFIIPSSTADIDAGLGIRYHF